MENFYKITKTQAESLGKINYESGKMFDPFCGEQNDGTYLVSESMYLLLKDQLDEIIDFTQLTKIDSSQLNNKVFEI